MSPEINVKEEDDLLRRKKIKVNYIPPADNLMQMSPSEEICEEAKMGGRDFIKLEESVIAALKVADDVALEEGEMTKSELRMWRKKMRMEKKQRREEKKKENEENMKKEKVGRWGLVSKYTGLWRREGGTKVIYYI